MTRSYHFSKVNYFDLENPIDAQRLDQAMLALQSLSGLIVIDEIQRSPELFPILRVLADPDLTHPTSGIPEL